MHPDNFPSNERGVVRMTVDGYRAFYPNPLPRRLNLPQEVVKLLDEATGAVHRLGGIGLLLPNPHLLITPSLNIEAVLSSRIEGTRTDIPQLLRQQAGQAPSSAEADDTQEVVNYVAAMEHGLKRLREGFPLSLRLVREMHQLLLQGVRGQYRLPGEFRTTPNWIGGTTLDNAVFVPPPPEAMVDALADWERFLHEQDMPLLIRLALVHYQFEVIHPFLDGNGRIGRMILPLMLILSGALVQPLLYLSAFFEQHRTEYYRLLLDISQKGDLLPWIQFFLRGVHQQAREAENRTVRIVQLQNEIREDLLATKRAPSVIRLAEHLFALPFVTAASAQEHLGVSRPTAHAAINALVERGDLIEITDRPRYRVYLAPRIYEAVYGPIDPANGRAGGI